MPHSLGERIVLFLRAKAPDEYNAKMIAAILKLNYSSVRKELSRLLKEEPSEIVREHRGFYRATTDLGIMRRQLLGKPVLFHGIELYGQILNKDTKLFFEAISGDKKRYRKRTFMNWNFEGRNVSVTYFDSGVIQIWLNTSDEKDALDYLAWGRFRAFLEGRFPGEFVGDFYLKQVDTHCDMREFQVRDFKGMRLKVFDNAWMHMYQKTQDILRLEVSMVPRELKFSEACEIIKTLVQVPTEATYIREPQEKTDRFDHSYS